MEKCNKKIALGSGIDSKFISDIIEIILHGRDVAYKAVNESMVRTYWAVGKRIVEKSLTEVFGKGFTERNLRSFRQFYVLFPDYEIWHARVPNLKWTHFRSLITVDNPTIGLILSAHSKNVF